MVKFIPYLASLLALSQAVAAAKAVTSFSEWVDGILENPNGDNMTPEEVVDAYMSGEFTAQPSGIFSVQYIRRGYMEANIREDVSRFSSRSLLQKRATCYEQPNTDCLVRNMQDIDQVALLKLLLRSDLRCCCMRQHRRSQNQLPRRVPAVPDR
jgi:hypothetical protein